MDKMEILQELSKVADELADKARASTVKAQAQSDRYSRGKYIGKAEAYTKSIDIIDDLINKIIDSKE